MSESSEPIPHLAIVRIATTGGPYRPGDVVSLAFNEPTVARLLPHGPPSSEVRATQSVVPESVSGIVQAPAEPYRAGDVVTLSFIDPSVARLHVAYAPVPLTLEPSSRTEDAPAIAGVASIRSTPAAAATPRAATGPFGLVRTASTPAPQQQSNPRGEHGPIVRLEWPPERAARFVQVVDKLFTVDRLGWYRHVLATRLLVSEEITRVGSPEPPEAYASANATLKIVRAAGLEALGTPLLAAYLPSFTVSSEWLSTIDDYRLSSALESLRDQLELFDREPLASVTPVRGSIVTDLTGAVMAGSATERNVQELLARLVPTVACDANVSDALSRYRESYLDLFAQMAPAAGAVRIRQMAQPNAVLDDRLWTLVGAVQESLSSEETATGV